MVGPDGRGRGWQHHFYLEYVCVRQQECKSVCQRPDSGSLAVQLQKQLFMHRFHSHISKSYVGCRFMANAVIQILIPLK